MSKSALTTPTPLKDVPAPTPFKAADRVRVLKPGTMDPVKAIRKLRDK